MFLLYFTQIPGVRAELYSWENEKLRQCCSLVKQWIIEPLMRFIYNTRDKISRGKYILLIRRSCLNMTTTYRVVYLYYKALPCVSNKNR